MSVATEFAPSFPLPEPSARPAPLATVTALRAPHPRSVAAPLRLTRRGVHVLALAVAALGAALVWVAALSAPRPGPVAPAGPALVTVESGDTLWSIAQRVAPGRDPRAEVATLQRINRLSGAQLAPGQLLRVH